MKNGKNGKNEKLQCSCGDQYHEEANDCPGCGLQIDPDNPSIVNALGVIALVAIFGGFISLIWNSIVRGEAWGGSVFSIGLGFGCFVMALVIDYLHHCAFHLRNLDIDARGRAGVEKRGQA